MLTYEKLYFQSQECISVGCVPPDFYHMVGGLPERDPTLDRNPPGQRPPWTETSPGQRPPLDRDLPWIEMPRTDTLWAETP